MNTFNILVIDDEFKEFKTFLVEKIESITSKKNPDYQLDFTFRDTVAGGNEELDKRNFYDLIILDLVFENVKGDEQRSFELLRHIKENHSHIPVLMLSLSKKYEDIKKASFESEYRPDDFLNKHDVLDKSNYELLYDRILTLLRKFGRINVTDGILITHGTDTMAWAFAILRYGLYNLKTNIVITGSQLPLEGTFSPSDAIGNMLTSVKMLNMLVPPNIIQVFNDGVHIFNKNLNKVKKWSVDAFYGNSFGQIEHEQLNIFEDDVYSLNIKNRLEKLYFVKMGGTIDAVQGKEGLEATGDFTDKYIRELGKVYFEEYETIRINPKDSSLFNPIDWVNSLLKIQETKLAAADVNFDWNILTLITNPLLTKDYYETMANLITEKYSGGVILGYGAGNVNIFGSNKTQSTKDYSYKFADEYGGSAFEKQSEYSLIPLFEKVEKYNTQYPEDYKFLIMSSQVPIDNYDIDYQAGRIPLYYGALPSGDLSYPEAQTKLAFILGHKDIIKEQAKKNNLTYEQLVKSCFLSGIKFNKTSNLKEFLIVSAKECDCKVVIHPKNVFVKNKFEDGLKEIIHHLKK
jgi:L-asparaginase/Glu-tRNA(Gln) amidotransferase subunit D